MRINNIFPSIQGEGKYTGHPALFIRTSGCNRDCQYCFGINDKVHKPKVCRSHNKEKVSIDEVKIGDKIITYDNDGKEIVETNVTNVMEREVDEYYRIVTNNKYSYLVTGEHPIFTTRGLVKVKDMKEGDIIKCMHFDMYNKLELKLTSIKKIKGKLKVYNISCHPYNSYIIDRMWVHNCDTKYHKDGRKIKLSSIVRAVKKTKLDNIVWTGGEPILQQDDIYEVIEKTSLKYNKSHHLETNGDIFPKHPDYFDYICFSPKEERTAVRIKEYTKSLNGPDYDIKVVTDLNLNKDLIKYATILMPLTTGNADKDKQIQQKVWKYCVHNNINYSQRIHIDVWGNRKGV